MKKRAKSINNPNIKLATDFQDSAFSMILWAFSAAYLPACNAIVSLVNLPMRNAGIIYLVFIFEMPAPKKSGVVGRGNNE